MTSVTPSAIARVAYEARRLYCCALGHDEHPPWEQASSHHRRDVLLGVDAVLSGTAPSGAHLHDTWSRHATVLPPYEVLVPGYDQLSMNERRKLLVFRAVILALVDGPCTGFCHDDRCANLEDHACHLDTCMSRFGIPPGLWTPHRPPGGVGDDGDLQRAELPGPLC
jgi:hypothetical protein